MLFNQRVSAKNFVINVRSCGQSYSSFLSSSSSALGNLVLPSFLLILSNYAKNDAKIHNYAPSFEMVLCVCNSDEKETKLNYDKSFKIGNALDPLACIASIPQRLNLKPTLQFVVLKSFVY